MKKNIAFIYFIFIIFNISMLDASPKVLHLTFHRGCQTEVEALAQEFSLDLTTWFIPDLPPGWFDGQAQGCALYNIDHARAERIWQLHKPFFETFDAIITTDTAPLARIFLQNHWKKPLIVWICNRFDYTDQASLDCTFPDPEYYSLFSKAHSQSNVKVIAYTEFEHYYALSKGVHTGKLTITPGLTTCQESKHSLIPSMVSKPQSFFLPPYHNETHFMDLSGHCNSLGLSNYCGRYNGPYDLKDFKGIIHIPYAWSNLSLFENLQLGIPYFIPSPSFLFELSLKNTFFHQDISYLINHNLIHLSEWYNQLHAPLFIYFDSWQDLQYKANHTDYTFQRKKIAAFSQKYRKRLLQKWEKVLTELKLK